MTEFAGKMKIVDSCQTNLTLGEVLGKLDLSLWSKIQEPDSEAQAEWVRRKAELHHRVGEYITKSLHHSDRDNRELSIILKALRSFELTDNQISQLMTMHRITASDNGAVYVESIVRDQTRFTIDDIERIRCICSYLRSDVIFNEADIMAIAGAMGLESPEPELSERKKIRPDTDRSELATP